LKSKPGAHRLLGWAVKDNGQLVIVPDPAAGQAVGQGSVFYFLSVSLEELRASIREQVGDAELGVKYAWRLAQEYLEAHDAARDESSKIQAKADWR